MRAGSLCLDGGGLGRAGRRHGAQPQPEVVRLAEAQCAKFGRRAVFQWDVELVAEDRGWPNAGGYVRVAPPSRLRDSGNHHARFGCVEP